MKNLQELADHIAAEPTEKSLSRRVYKDTACGAWLEVVKNDDASVWGVRIGSIVEGSDACVDPRELEFPFTETKWNEALQDVEYEADYLWRQANECC